MEKYPVITLHQPWAQLIALGWKTIETRGHNRFRNLKGKEILIHAGGRWNKYWEEQAMPYLTQEQIDKIKAWGPVPASILCKAFVEDARRLNEEDSPNALIKSHNALYGLILSNIQPIESIHAKGGQGIWYWTGDFEQIADDKAFHKAHVTSSATDNNWRKCKHCGKFI